MLQGIRTAHNSSGVVVPSIAEKTTSNPVVQLKPSQLKAAQRGSPTTATCPVTPALWKCMPKNSSLPLHWAQRGGLPVHSQEKFFPKWLKE
uniref:Uncharacterized protein n=1 Tax=Ditylenchus dipsaci TaxID=166011 RepID=A0A915D8G7_9BILA